MNYKIILFYNYTKISDPELLRAAQRELCEDLNLKGRIIVAKEGINATLEGEADSISKYLEILKSDKRFADTHIKISDGDGNSFPKLSVKVRDEIVSTDLGDDDVDPNEITGKYLTADELHEWYENGEEFYIVDMRNDYEHMVGHFKNSILPEFKNFRDLPRITKEISDIKDKKVLTVCTGGVRCEKASGYLITQGFKDVYQLYGGMVTYMEKYPNKNFLGKLYVFDERKAIAFEDDSPEYVVVGRCARTGVESENIINCDNADCHKQVIVCEKLIEKEHGAFCSEECRDYIAQHPEKDMRNIVKAKKVKVT